MITQEIGGPLHSDDDYLFTVVTGLFLDPQGNAFVGDARFGNIRVYSPAGRLLRTIGRRGEGPGDLRDPCCFTLDSADRLWVRDGGNSRYTAFDLRGRGARQVATIRMPYHSGVPISFPAWDRAGNLMHVARRQDGPSAGRLQQSFLSPTSAVIRQVMLPPERDPDPARVQVLVRKGEGGRVIRTEVTAPFTGHALYAFSRGGERVSAHMDRYAIEWYSMEGALLRTLRRDLPGPEVTASERAAEENKLVSRARQLGVPRAAIRVQVPRSKPPIQKLGFDQDGRLWVHLTVPEGAPQRADLYTPDGKLVAAMEWPAHVTLYQHAARDSVAIGVAKDADDVRSIVRLTFRAVRRDGGG